MFEDVLNLILVGDDKSKEYCELMAMLISAKDDKKEKVSEQETKLIEKVGIMDGSVACQIWTDKNYADTPTSSEQKFLFIGDTDASKKINSNIRRCDDNNFGVKMGWMGNKAIISVDYDVMKNDLRKKYTEFYNAYFALCKQYDPNMLVDNQSAEKAENSFFTTIEKKYESIGSKDNSKVTKTLKKGGTLVATGTGLVIAPIAFSVVALGSFFKNSSKRKQLIIDQMYRYGVLKFYLKHLENFMKE